MRPVRARYLAPMLAFVMAVGGLTGCARLPFDTYYQAASIARRGVAQTTCDMAVRFGELALSLPPGSMTVASLDAVATPRFSPYSSDPWVNPYYSPEESEPDGASPSPSTDSGLLGYPPRYQLVYSLDSGTTASSVGFFAFSSGAVPDPTNGQDASLAAYGCAALLLTYQTKTVTVTSEECPAWLAQFAIHNDWQASFGGGWVSLTDVTESQFGVDQWQVAPFDPSGSSKSNPNSEGVVPWPPSACRG